MIITVISKKKRELFIACFVMLVTVVLVGSAVYYAERHQDDFNSILNGIYWACVALTTGNTESNPETVLGKIINVFSCFVGIAFVALPTSILSSGFAEQLSIMQEQERERKEEIRRHQEKRERQLLRQQRLQALQSGQISQMPSNLNTAVDASLPPSPRGGMTDEESDMEHASTISRTQLIPNATRVVDTLQTAPQPQSQLPYQSIKSANQSDNEDAHNHHGESVQRTTSGSRNVQMPITHTMFRCPICLNASTIHFRLVTNQG